MSEPNKFVSTGIDWNWCKRELESQPVVGDVRELYIGTLMNLTPSGKYYTPWACSNVTEAEAAADEEWWERANAEAESFGLYIATSEDCPTDVIVGQVMEV